jgi:hypothetical protein
MKIVYKENETKNFDQELNGIRKRFKTRITD